MINGVPRILLVRLSAIGDVVRVLPALHGLRDKFPNAQIDWAVERKSAGILEDHPALDRCLVFERPEGRIAAFRAFLTYLRLVREGRYDIVLDFHGIFKSGLITFASRAAQRIGFAAPRSREFSRLACNRRVALPATPLNRIEENLALAAAVGVESHALDVVIDIPEEVQDHIDEYFEEISRSGKQLVAVHVPVDRPEKQWPLERYAALCDLILADGRFEVVLTWGPGQMQTAQEVFNLARRKPYLAPETATLKDYAYFVSRCAVYVGGDTGPMHIASAIGTPVVAIFGGTDPARHAPLRNPSEVLYAGPAAPPRRIGAAQAAGYFRAIEPEAVYDAVIRMAHAGGPAGTA